MAASLTPYSGSCMTRLWIRLYVKIGSSIQMIRRHGATGWNRRKGRQKWPATGHKAFRMHWLHNAPYGLILVLSCMARASIYQLGRTLAPAKRTKYASSEAAQLFVMSKTLGNSSIFSHQVQMCSPLASRTSPLCSSLAWQLQCHLCQEDEVPYKSLVLVN